MWVFQDGVWFFDGEPVDDATQEILAPFNTFLNGSFFRQVTGPEGGLVTLADPPAMHINTLAALRGFEAPEGALATGPDFLQDDDVLPQQFPDSGVPPLIGLDSRGNRIILPWVPEVQKWGLVDPITGRFSGIGPDDPGVSPSLKQQVAAAEFRGDESEAERLAIRSGQLEALTRAASGIDDTQFSSLQEAADFAFIQGTEESLTEFDRLNAELERLSPSERAEIDREMAAAKNRNQIAVDQQRLREEQFDFKKSEAALDRMFDEQVRAANAAAAERERRFRIAESPADIFTQSAIAGGGFGPPPTGGRIRALPNQFLTGGEIPLPRFARDPFQEVEDIGVVPTSDVVNMGTTEQPINIRSSDLQRIRQSGGALGVQDVPHLSFSMQDNGFVESPFVIPPSVRSLGDVPITPPSGMVTPSDVARFQTGFKEAKAQGFEGEEAIRVVNEAFNQPGSDRIAPPAGGFGGFQTVDDENFVQELEAEGLTRNEAIEVSDIDFEEEF